MYHWSFYSSPFVKLLAKYESLVYFPAGFISIKVDNIPMYNWGDDLILLDYIVYPHSNRFIKWMSLMWCECTPRISQKISWNHQNKQNKQILYCIRNWGKDTFEFLLWWWWDSFRILSQKKLSLLIHLISALFPWNSKCLTDD